MIPFLTEKSAVFVTNANARPYLKASKHCAAHGAKILICISDDLCVRNTLYRLQTCERSECAAAA